MIHPDNISEIQKEALDNIRTAKSNISRGFKMLVFAIARMFVEAWIIQEIWNQVLTDITTTITPATYWQAFFVMVMVRILTGQFKISFGSTTPTNTNAKK